MPPDWEQGMLASADKLMDAAPEPVKQARTLLYTIISVGLVIMAGLMSGLTIGMMAMDDMELEVLKRSGSHREKKYARAITPLLTNHHYLLVTLVLWNAAAMEALPIFLDRLADPVTAVVLSVTVVLIFGEIVPQSICSQHGLAVGYYTSPLLRMLMLLAWPVAWPLGKCLDAILGHGDSALPRGQLREYVSLHADEAGFVNAGQGLNQNELNVINSALELTSKTARTAMTPLDKVYMLPADAVMDEALVATIMKSGHSRVPVHEASDRTKIVGLLLVKELLLKVHQNVKVGSLKMRSLPVLSATMPMYDILHLFKTGRTHMALLCEVPEGKRDEVRQELRKHDATPAKVLARMDSAFGATPQEFKDDETQHLLAEQCAFRSRGRVQYI